MCGIDGVASTDPARASLAEVGAMNAALRHRGPDDGGALELGFARLGMRRLSIRDRVGGRQPMHSPGGSLALVYNGEIYGCQEHAAELARRGSRTRGRSDTEVLAALWEQCGEDCLPRLNGIFAFAVADRRDRSLTLVRDALGVKPLFYWHSPAGELVFASEIGALLAHPRVPRRLDRASLSMLLADRYVAAPWTLLEGVRELPPGHRLRWKDGRVELARWADPRPCPQPMREDEALAELERALGQAVEAQRESDVPLGVLLSGGLDSGLVAAFAAQRAEGPLDSFSVGFSRPDYDESASAREVARHLGTRHHEARIEDAAFEVAMLDRIVEHVGQPLGDASCVPTWVVSKLAAEHVGVVFSGDGGDELFGGYEHVRWAGRLRRAARSPALLRRVARGLLDGARPGVQLIGGFLGDARAERLAAPLRRASKGLALSFLDPVEQFRRMRGLWSADELRGLLAREARAELRPELPELDAAWLELEPEELALALLARTYLPGAILAKVDRMSMAVGLEVRVPLLDARVVALALRLPLDLKLRAGRSKVLLRRLARSRLPARVLRRPKHGFSLPLADWLNAEFWELCEALYAPGSRAAALFEPAALRVVLEHGRRAGQRVATSSQAADATRAWVLAMLARWMERFEVAA